MPETVVEAPRAISADILPPKQGPALSATSDMPIKEAAAEPEKPAEDKPEAKAKEEPKAEPAKPEIKVGDKPKVEAAKPEDKPEPEKKDETPAWQKREITIERNKRRAADEARVAAETRAERAEKAAARALELAEKVAASTAKAEATDAADIMPKRDAFDNPDKYDEALGAWMSRHAERVATAALDRQKADDAKTEADRLKAEADKAHEEELRGRAIVFQERATKFKEQAQDFDDLVMRAPDEGGPVITHQMSGAMLEADNGPEIAYHLAKHVDESQRIANLTPARQVYEIGRLSTRLENEATARAAQEIEKKISKVPEPIAPLKTANGNASPKTPDEETMEEYALRRKAEIAAKNRVRA